MTMSGNAAMHSVCVSHNCWVNACVQTHLRTALLSLPVHALASILLVQPVERAKQVASVGSRDMKIDKRGFDALVPQQLFDGYNIHPDLKQTVTVPYSIYRKLKIAQRWRFTLPGQLSQVFV